ncbi:lipase 3-like [Bacillus rossius redtenbacheri]|uniref:lipase 3-like n=1 Tax=Bacillus rossius redtenbacheri TaxID=93214 RepID=UPI002FDCCA44
MGMQWNLMLLAWLLELKVHRCLLSSDPYADVPDIVRLHGYPVETHAVVTADGYVLTLHRLPARRARGARRAPVLLQHGLLDSSACFAVNGPRQSLAYVLWGRGYDVWLSNSRGNYYSTGHVNLTRDNPRYWSFSFQEMGIYDEPAIIDYVLKITRHPKLIYVAHSMGAAIFFAMMNFRPEYNAKLTAAFLLAPACFCRYTKSFVFRFLPQAIYIKKAALNSVGIYEVLPRLPLWQDLAAKLCSDMNPILQLLCTSTLSSIEGSSPDNINKTQLVINFSHFPAGASIQTIAHYGQIMLSGNFNEYDYGIEENRAFYEEGQPKAYRLHHVTIPVIMYCGGKDLLSDCEDIKHLYTQLVNSEDKYFIFLKEYAHVDFIWGMDARSYLYKDLVARMDSHMTKHLQTRFYVS